VNILPRQKKIVSFTFQLKYSYEIINDPDDSWMSLEDGSRCYATSKLNPLDSPPVQKLRTFDRRYKNKKYHIITPAREPILLISKWNRYKPWTCFLNPRRLYCFPSSLPFTVFSFDMEGDARGDRRSRRIQTTIDRVGSLSPRRLAGRKRKRAFIMGPGKKDKRQRAGCFYVWVFLVDGEGKRWADRGGKLIRLI
jgi:hypothetical protein